MKRIYLLVAAMLLVQFYSHAQRAACGTTEANDYLISHDKAYAESLRQQLKSWVEYSKKQQNGQASPIGTPPTGAQGLVTNTTAGALYTIPLVFHIIHTGQAVGTAQNPSDATIQSLVAYMNQVYTATWASNPDTNNGGVRVPIQFVLAQRSPTCTATTGINRVNGSSVTGYTQYGLGMSGSTTGASETAIKALSMWPNDKYINIWIVTNIQGAAANGGGVAGFAYFPGAPASIDGVTLRYDQTNWAISHEVGHVLGLYHTFEGSSDATTCPTNTDCTAQGDHVCDTDPHPLVSGCPTGINPCTNVGYGSVTYNIMNYSSCPNRFTTGQRTRMIFELQTYRGSLLTSLGGIAPGTYPTNISAPPTTCVPTTIAHTGYDLGPSKITLADLTYYSGGYVSDGNQFYIDHTVNTCLQTQLTVHLNTGTPYTMTVTPGSSNNESVRTWIDWNNNGTFESTEQVMYVYNYSQGAPASASFTVPATGVVTCTPLRMRVSSDFYGSTTPTVCGNPQYGQVEDFTVVVQSSATPTVSISSPDTSVCAGSTATFTASTTGTGGTMQWKKNGVNVGSGTTTYSYIPANGDTITCSYAVSNLCYAGTVASNVIRMNVRPMVTPTNTVAVSPGNTVCAGTAVTFTSTTNIGGGTIQWRKNGVNTGSGGTSYSYIPANGDTVSCVLTTPAGGCYTTTSLTSNATIMTVTPNVTPTNVISVSPGTTICAGTAVTFTSTNNISGGTIQWKKNGVNAGSGGTTYSYTPVNGDSVSCVLTMPTGCYTTTSLTSNSFKMTVTPNVTPTNVISVSPGTSVCTGTAVTFTSTNNISGGTIQWKKNGVNAGSGGTTYSYTPANGDTVSCILTTSGGCYTTPSTASNTITITATPNVTPTNAISVSPSTTICAGTTVMFSSTNNISGGSIQWKRNGINTGSTGVTYSYIPTNGDTITCVLTTPGSGCYAITTATSNAIGMNVQPVVTPTNTITANAGNNICTGTEVIFTSTTNTSGGTVQWMKNGTAVDATGLTYIYVPADGDVITSMLTTSSGCYTDNSVTSNAINMAVQPIIVPASTITANPGTTICAGTEVMFTNANNVAGGTLQWMINNMAVGVGNATYSYTPANGDAVTCMMTVPVNGCYTTTYVTSDVISMVVQPVVTPANNITTDAGNTVCAGTTVTFTSTNNISGGTIQWMRNDTAVGTGDATYSYIPTNGDIITCVLTPPVDGTCYTATSVTSSGITMTVTPNIEPADVISATPGATVCAGTAVTFTSDANVPDATLIWMRNDTVTGAGGTTYSYMPNDGDVITCMLVMPASGCYTTSSVTSNGIGMTVQPNITPTSAISVSPGNTVYADSAVTFTDVTNISGATYQWQKNGTNVNASGTTYSYIPANGDSVTCMVTVPGTGCYTTATATSNVIGITVVQPVVIKAGTITGLNYICVGATITLADTSGTPGGIWSSTNTTKATVNQDGVVTGIAQGVDTIKYTINGLVAKKTITVYALPVVSAGADVARCQGAAAVTLMATGGTSYVWTPSAGLSCTTCASPIATPTITTSYIVTGTKTTCSTKDTVKVTVNPQPVAGTITGAAIVSPGAIITLTDNGGMAGGIWSSVSTPIATVDQAGIVTGIGFGSDTIKYTVTNSCGTAVARKLITVSSAGYINGGSYMCVGATIAFADSAGAPGGIWSSVYTSKATVNQNGFVTGVAQGVDTIKYTVNGLVARKAITIYALPVINAGADVTICQGTPAALAAAGGTSYVWSPATGLSCTTCASPTATPTITTNYIVTGTKTGCSSKDTVKVSINPMPNAGVINGPETFAPNTTGNMTDATGMPGGTWSSAFTNIATISNTGTVTAVAAGSDTITYTVANSCGTATAKKVINIAIPARAGTITGINYVCVGSTISLSDSGGTAGGTWSSLYTSKATVSQAGVVTGVSQGVDTIKYTVGGVVARKAITVYALPVVNAGADVSIAAGSSITLMATGASSYTWSPAAGLSCTNCASPVASPGTTTSYIVTGTKTTCTARDTIKVTVNAAKGQPAGIGGIDDGEATEVKIYPNPVRNELNIALNLNNEDLQIALIDLTGKQVAEITNIKKANGAQHIVYNTSALARGIYYLQIGIDKHVAMHKVVVE